MPNGLGYPSVAPTLQIAGRIFTDLSNLIVLAGYASGSATPNFTARKFNGAAGYSVTVGKTLNIFAIDVQCTVGAAGAVLVLAQSDNDVGISSATALTNPVYIGGVSTVSSPIPLSTTGQLITRAIWIQIASGKFFSGTVNSTSAANFFAYGYES